MMVSSGRIEELGNRSSDFVESRPVEIAENDSLIGFAAGSFDQVQLAFVIFPGVAVVNQIIDPGPQVGVDRGGPGHYPFAFGPEFFQLLVNPANLNRSA